MVLRSGVPWPKNIQTVPELDLYHKPETSPDFTASRKRLMERMLAFSALAPEALLQSHPMLGFISQWEWMRWGYLHTDHHLRQFGC